MSFTKSLRIIIQAIMCAAVLCILTAPVFAQKFGRKKNVITLEHLIISLEKAKVQNTPITRLTELIREYGVDFRLTPEIENRIRSTASFLSKESLDDLVSTVRDNYSSIEKVIAFVKGKLSDSKFSYQTKIESVDFVYNNVEVGRCELSWQEKRTVRWHDTNASPDPTRFRFEINLSDIDPEQIKLERFLEGLEYWSIIIKTTNSEEKIKFIQFETSFRSKSEITFPDKTLAERVSAALKEWVKGCGGKREPY